MFVEIFIGSAVLILEKIIIGTIGGAKSMYLVLC